MYQRTQYSTQLLHININAYMYIKNNNIQKLLVFLHAAT